MPIISVVATCSGPFLNLEADEGDLLTPADGQRYPEYAWWRHQIETFSALLALCAGNSPTTGEFPSRGPVTWSFDVFFDLRLNKRLSKQSWGWWFETPTRSLWCHCNDFRRHTNLHFLSCLCSENVSIWWRHRAKWGCCPEHLAAQSIKVPDLTGPFSKSEPYINGALGTSTQGHFA